MSGADTPSRRGGAAGPAAAATNAHDRGPLWTPRTVAWYERANARSNYAERVLAAAAALLAGSRSALDVGAGFGALAVPLARRLAEVTALEPSPAMVAALRRAAAALPNLRVVEAAWGAVPVPPHDVVVCAHVSPLLDRGSSFLAALPETARRGAIIVRDAAGGDDKFFFTELYPVLLGRPYGKRCRADDTLAVLAEKGIVPAVTIVEYDSDQPFDSLEEACDFWMAYMGLEGEEPRGYLREFLGRRLRREGSGWLAPFRKRAAVLVWTR